MEIEEFTATVIQRLEKLSYQKLADIRTFESNPEFSIEELRGTLEEFFREIAKLAYVRKGVQFRGNPKQFSEVRQFIHSLGWLTEAESSLLNSFYHLLSGIIHREDSQSHINLSVGNHLCWYFFDLVSTRAETSPQIRATPRPAIPADYFVLARSFIEGMRRKRYRGRAFETHFDRDLMEMTRRLIRKSDIPFLFDLLSDTTASPGLRNRAASVLIAPCINKDESLRANVIQRMNEFYWKNRSNSPWQVLRGVALAIANRTNSADCILDYLDLIDEKNLVDDNLAETDSYYPNRLAAVEYYLGRLNNPALRSTSCVWEIFYVGKRAEFDKEIVGVLKRRLKMSEDERIQSLCSDAIDNLRNSSRQTGK